MKNINPQGVILTPSSMKHINMFCKVNEPFKMVQIVFKKGLSNETSAAFYDACEKSGSKLVYISRQYDGSERYALLYPSGVSIEFFPQDKNIIILL